MTGAYSQYYKEYVCNFLAKAQKNQSVWDIKQAKLKGHQMCKTQNKHWYPCEQDFRNLGHMQ